MFIFIFLAPIDIGAKYIYSEETPIGPTFDYVVAVHVRF